MGGGFDARQPAQHRRRRGLPVTSRGIMLNGPIAISYSRDIAK